MKNKDKQYFIPVDGELVEVTEEVYRAYYQPIWNTRYHAQKNGECRCTKAQLWKCDGICPGCPYYAAGKKVSIDTPIGGEDDAGSLGAASGRQDWLCGDQGSRQGAATFAGCQTPTIKTARLPGFRSGCSRTDWRNPRCNTNHMSIRNTPLTTSKPIRSQQSCWIWALARPASP